MPPRPGPSSSSSDATRMVTSRNALSLILVIASVFVFWTPLRTLLSYAMRRDDFQYDKYAHTILIPFLSMGLLYFERRRIFKHVDYSLRMGAMLLLVALTVNWSAESVPVKLLALVVFWIAGFILCYGTRAFRAGAFPLLFLLLIVPIPDFLLDGVIWVVRFGSTMVCSLLFGLFSVPALRNGFELSLSSVKIEVAEQCSGIHSTLGLLIVSLLAGHLFLSSVKKRVVLVLVALPIVCVTNGLRIAGLTLLAEYVDINILHSRLHHQGGMGFFLLALIFLFGILQILRSMQKYTEACS